MAAQRRGLCLSQPGTSVSAELGPENVSVLLPGSSGGDEWNPRSDSQSSHAHHLRARVRTPSFSGVNNTPLYARGTLRSAGRRLRASAWLGRSLRPRTRRPGAGSVPSTVPGVLADVGLPQLSLSLSEAAPPPPQQCTKGSHLSRRLFPPTSQAFMSP